MTDISNLSSTIVPKAEQLNAEELLSGPRTITITNVRMGNDEQPVMIDFEGDDGRPFKPGKTMRKLLIYAWGEDGRQWIGRSMTLFNEASVMFGGMKVGGIRISHLSDIAKPIQIAFTSTKGKKQIHSVEVLQIVTLADVMKAIGGATNKASMDKAKALALQLISPADKEAARTAYAARVQALKGPAKANAPAPAETPAPGPSDAPAAPTLDELKKRLEEAVDAEKGSDVLEQGMHLGQAGQQELVEAFNRRFP